MSGAGQVSKGWMLTFVGMFLHFCTCARFWQWMRFQEISCCGRHREDIFIGICVLPVVISHQITTSVLWCVWNTDSILVSDWFRNWTCDAYTINQFTELTFCKNNIPAFMLVAYLTLQKMCWLILFLKKGRCVYSAGRLNIYSFWVMAQTIMGRQTDGWRGTDVHVQLFDTLWGKKCIIMRFLCLLIMFFFVWYCGLFCLFICFYIYTILWGCFSWWS